MSERVLLGLTSTEWIAALTVVLAAAAVLQAAIYALTLRTTKRVERAYVKMSHRSPPGLSFGFIHSNSDDPIPKQDVSVRMQITNHGNTPARVTRVLIQPIIAIEPLPSTPRYDESCGEAIDAFLVPSDHIYVPKPMVIPYADIKTVRSAANNFAECRYPVRLFIIGYVDYIDRFGSHHRAGYARVYNEWLESKGMQPDDPTLTDRGALEERHRNRNNLVFISQPGYNYDRLRSRMTEEGSDWENG